MLILHLWPSMASHVKGAIMYAAVHKSSGIVAFRAIKRSMVEYWLECNEYTEEGKPLGLYRLVKLKDNT